MALDFKVENGDFVFENWDISFTSEPDVQWSEELLLASPGHFIADPVSGCMASQIVKGRNGLDRLKKKVDEQFKAEGFQDASITINQSGEIQLEALYGK